MQNTVWEMDRSQGLELCESNQNCLVLSIPNPRQWPYVHVNVSLKSLQQPSSARLKMRCTSETWRMESHGPHGAHNSWVWVRMSLLLQAHQKSLWGQTKQLGLWEVDFFNVQCQPQRERWGGDYDDNSQWANQVLCFFVFTNIFPPAMQFPSSGFRVIQGWSCQGKLISPRPIVVLR